MIAIFLEAEYCHVSRQHILPVLVGLFPGLEVGAEPVVPLTSHLKQGEAHLVERDPQ